MNPIKSLLRRSVRTLGRFGLLKPETVSRLLYRIQMGHWADISAPVDLNEKLLWMMFRTDTHRWSELADKVGVRRYVEEQGLGNLLIPLLGVYESAEEIDFETLPDSFVLKSNNASMQVAIVRDKRAADLEGIRRQADHWLRSRFSLAGGEPHYSAIPPRLLAEKLLPLPDDGFAVDYKFMCFDGEPRYCLVCTERETAHFHCKVSFYGLPDWRPLPDWVVPDERDDELLDKPRHLERMMDVARRLAGDFPFVRVDLYAFGDEVFFGELTFTPAAGRIGYCSTEGLIRLGEQLKLPQFENNNTGNDLKSNTKT